MDIHKILEERNETHGSFVDNATVSQELKEVLRRSKNWDKMHHVHREALEYICGKIGRICSGQFDFDDSWKDCAGYAELPIKFNHGKEKPREGH